MRVRWLRKALLNLAGEAEYLAREDPVAAGHTVARISEVVARLVTFQKELERARLARKQAAKKQA